MTATTQSESAVLTVQPVQQLDVATLDAASLILGPSWDRIQAFGKMMARGTATIPLHLKGNEADCTAIAMQALGWRMNPFAVAQKTHVTQGGQLGYEAQLVNAVIQASGALDGDPDYEYIGDWSKVLGKVEERKSDKGGKYYVATYTRADEAGLGVIVKAKLRGEAKARELQVLMSQCYPRFSTQWATDPKQQISYLALRKFVRLHKPGVILGVYAQDELEPIPGEKFMGPADLVQPPATPTPPPPPAAPEVWPDDKLKQRFPKYVEWLSAGKSHDEIIAFAETKGKLTEPQKKLIRALTPSAAEGNDKVDDVPAITFAQIADRIVKATNADQLDEAQLLISALQSPEHRSELDAKVEARRAELSTTKE